MWPGAQIFPLSSYTSYFSIKLILQVLNLPGYKSRDMDWQNVLGYKQGYTQQPCSGVEEKLFQSSSGCGEPHLSGTPQQLWHQGYKVGFVRRLLWGCSWSRWLHLAAQMKNKNKSSYQTHYTILFYLLFSTSFTMPTVNPVSWKICISLILLERGFPQVIQSITAFAKKFSSPEKGPFGEASITCSHQALRGRAGAAVASFPC